MIDIGNFFGSMYTSLFEDFFGQELANYLWGGYSPEALTNQYIGIGLWMMSISLIVVVAYYYILDHPKLANWWGWLIFLAVNAVINFIVGWQWVLKDYYDDKMITVDPSTNSLVTLNIGESEIVCFGLSNMFLSIMFFIVFTFIVKWWSRNCSHVPV